MTFDFEPYCSKCRDVEPVVNVVDMLNFFDDSDVEIVISCAYAKRCKALTEYLNGQKID